MRVYILHHADECGEAIGVYSNYDLAKRAGDKWFIKFNVREWIVKDDLDKIANGGACKEK